MNRMRQAVSHTCVYVSAWAQGIEIPPFVSVRAPGLAISEELQNKIVNIVEYSTFATCSSVRGRPHSSGSGAGFNP